MNEFCAEKLLLLHASGIKINGEAYLFLGPSGTGKSSLAQLLSYDYPLLSDDTVYLTVNSNGGWGVIDASDRKYKRQDLPSWDEVKQQTAVPLGAVFRLMRQPSPQIVPLGIVETCKYLTGAALELQLQQNASIEVKQAIFSTLKQVSQIVPGFEFHFNLTQYSCNVFRAAIQDHTTGSV